MSLTRSELQSIAARQANDIRTFEFAVNGNKEIMFNLRDKLRRGLISQISFNLEYPEYMKNLNYLLNRLKPLRTIQKSVKNELRMHNGKRIGISESKFIDEVISKRPSGGVPSKSEDKVQVTTTVYKIQKDVPPLQLHGLGDVTSTEKGSGARYNAGKPDYSLI